MNPFLYFTDSVLRAPTLGSMIIGALAALVGVILILRKQALAGEVLSHASYPGLLGGFLISAFFGAPQFFSLAGSFIISLLALKSLDILQHKAQIKADSALTLVLSSFFGIGVLLSSLLQFTYTNLYSQSLTFLYGQSATLTDFHVYLYGSIGLVFILFLTLFHKEIKMGLFDPSFTEIKGSYPLLQNLLIAFSTLVIVMGIRGVGVVLMSAFLIAPALTALKLSHSLTKVYVSAAFFGALSAFFGSIFSNELTLALSGSGKVSIPTGPTIVVIASLFALFSFMWRRRS